MLFRSYMCVFIYISVFIYIYTYLTLKARPPPLPADLKRPPSARRLSVPRWRQPQRPPTRRAEASSFQPSPNRANTGGEGLAGTRAKNTLQVKPYPEALSRRLIQTYRRGGVGWHTCEEYSTSKALPSSPQPSPDTNIPEGRG